MNTVLSLALLATLQYATRLPRASTLAPKIDQLFIFLTVITLFFTILIFAVIFYFMVKYRRRHPYQAQWRRVRALAGRGQT